MTVTGSMSLDHVPVSKIIGIKRNSKIKRNTIIYGSIICCYCSHSSQLDPKANVIGIQTFKHFVLLHVLQGL